MGSSDKRRTPRIQPFVVACRVVYGDGRRGSAFLTDLSTAGAQVTCEFEPPAPGGDVVLEVRFDRRAGTSRLPAQVKWVQTGERRHSFGLTFEAISAEERRTLEAVVEEFRRRAAQIEIA
jgi:hypothetical protein